MLVIQRGIYAYLNESHCSINVIKSHERLKRLAKPNPTKCLVSAGKKYLSDYRFSRNLPYRQPRFPSPSLERTAYSSLD